MTTKKTTTVKQVVAEPAASKTAAKPAEVEKKALSIGEAIDQILEILRRLDGPDPLAVAETVVALCGPSERSVSFQYKDRWE